MIKSKHFAILLFTLVSCVAIFVSFRYVQAVIVRIKAEKDFKQAIKQVDNIEGLLKTERQNFQKQKEQFQGYLKEAEGKITALTMESVGRQEEILLLVKQTEALKKERESSDKRMAEIEARLSRITEEKKRLEEKIQSIPELKNMIRQLIVRARKTIVRDEPHAQDKGFKENANKGFIIKDGMANNSEKVKIEVRPAQ